MWSDSHSFNVSKALTTRLKPSASWATRYSTSQCQQSPGL